MISEKTTALAVIYKNRCLVDKTKSSAVKIYLTYEIEKAKIEERNEDLALLEQEVVFNNLNVEFVHEYFLFKYQ